MAANQSSKSKAWPLFDHIVAVAAPEGQYSNPWVRTSDGKYHFQPDYDVLKSLLGVPLYLNAPTQTGIPALALDVWLSYELRRAGFISDQVWPRPTHPRILPMTVAKLLEALPKQERSSIERRLSKDGTVSGVTSASASILGKNYLKQVDVIMTDWATGPELLVSTKRMDSSFGKNAPNRIEESYGDAKNLRLRHPIAALGFLFGLRSTILKEERDTAEWLFDQIAKLGQEDDAYHSTCVILIEYADDTPPESDESSLEQMILNLPKVDILSDQVPEGLDPENFLSKLVTHVLSSTPVNMHTNARKIRAAAASISSK